MGVIEAQVEILEVASYIAKKNNLYEFICIFPCLPVPPKPNTSIRFRLANVSKLPLTNSPLSLKLSAWASFLSKYPNSSGLRIHLPMILYFRAKLCYEGLSNAFIVSDNLTSVLQDPTIIE